MGKLVCWNDSEKWTLDERVKYGGEGAGQLNVWTADSAYDVKCVTATADCERAMKAATERLPRRLTDGEFGLQILCTQHGDEISVFMGCETLNAVECETIDALIGDVRTALRMLKSWRRHLEATNADA